MPSIAKSHRIATGFFGLLLSLVPVFAQETDPALQAWVPEVRVLALPLRADTLGIGDFVTPRKSHGFRRLDTPVRTDPGETYWIRLDFRGWAGKLAAEPHWILKTGVFQEATLFLRQGDSLRALSFGSFQRAARLPDSLPNDRIAFDASGLIGGHYLFLKLRKLNGTGRLRPDTFKVYTPTGNALQMAREGLEKERHAAVLYLFLGLAVPMFLFTLGVYLQNRQRDFLLYALYLLCLILFFGRGKIPGYESLVGSDSFLSFFGSNAFEILSSLFYTGFTMEYLRTKTAYPAFHRLLLGILGFLGVLLLADSALLLGRAFQAHHTLLNARALVLSAFVLFAIVYLYSRGKSPLANIIATGSASYSLGSVGLFLTGNLSFMLLGVLLEIMVFGYGLAYKMYHLQREKQSLERETTLQRISALRAQMNPHFIFNSLAAIQHLITRNDRLGALKYLNKFASLMRRTLEHSVTARISLAEEIRFLTQYLEIEMLRFEGAFTFAIEVNPDLDPEAVEVPLLLVQPFVENALLHGLMPKKEGGRALRLYFSQENGFLKCVVDDNGIGREASRALKDRYGKRNPSRGMEVTRKRLELIPGSLEGSGKVSITDKKDAEGNPLGTQVTLWVPMEKNH